MLETIDGGAAAAKSRSLINADTSWEPDFEEEPDFPSNGIVPNITTPSEDAVECSFDSWALSDNEMEAINQYNKEPLSDAPPPPPPPKAADVTARTTNVKTLNASTESEVKRQSRLAKAKQKYDKLVKSPRLKEQAAKQREEERGAAQRRRERRESKKDKFKKMIKYKSNSPPKPVVSPDSKVFDPWLTPAEASNTWESTGGEWAKDEEQDEEQVEEQNEEQHEEQDDEVALITPVKKASTEMKSQDIFRPKGVSAAPPVQPSPANKELTDVLKDVQGNLEVSAITKSTSFVLDDTAEFDYDFNLDSTPINVRDRDFQSKIDEKIADGPAQEQQEEEEAEAEAEPVAPPAGKMAFFTCGTIEVEFPSPKQVMVDFTGDVKTRVRNGVRSFFGQCDVSDGADVVAEHVQETKKTWKENVNVSRDHTKDYVAFGYKRE